MPAKRRKPELSVEQVELVGQFADYASDFPNLSFDEAAKKVLGPRGFPNTPSGRKFRREAQAVFDRERASGLD